jgi:membrane protease YdiL (CAAX protease family)
MNRLYKWYQWWKNLSPILFVIFTALLANVLTIPIAYGFELAGLSEKDIGFLDLEKYGPLALIALVVILGPMLETLMAQSLPFYLIRKYVRWNPSAVAVIVSTIFFSLLHASYSYWYSLAMIPSGLLLAFTFMVFQDRKESAFWMTAAVHGIANLLTLAGWWMENGISK